MPVQRYFLGWDEPVTAKVRAFLMPQRVSGPVDLEKDLIVVPTHQAGRRLLETLALFCAEADTALLSAQVAYPKSFFRHSQEETQNEASPSVIRAVWSNLLLKIDLNKYTGFFPAPTQDRDFDWGIRTGEIIQRLRNQLADGGYRISDVLDTIGDNLEEPERWRDLAEMEAAYLKCLNDMNLQDPCLRKMEQAEAPDLPDGVERIVVAAVPDPSLLMIRALDRLSKRVHIDILIHAPDSLSEYFDEWGRPDPAKWNNVEIDIPNAESNVILTGSPVSQSRRVLEEIAAMSDKLGPSDIAIGVPDRTVVPFLEAHLEEEGLPAFDPSDKLLQEHSLYRLIEAYADLINEGSYRAFSTFLRHPDILDILQHREDKQDFVFTLLKELDEFQNLFLPVTLEDITRHLSESGKYDGFEHLEKAFRFAQEQVKTFGRETPGNAIRSFMQTVYEARRIDSGIPEDDEFRQVAEKIDASLRELDSEYIEQLDVDKNHFLEFLLRRLAEQEYHRERKDSVIDLEGWLELTWNDALFLIVTGMNEESVPGTNSTDVFLPDSLRSRLKLRDDASRFARDTFLMRGFIESRRQDGRVCFIAGKTGSAGDPLKPSRLLFRCRDDELAKRARQLFGPVEEKRENLPSTISFKLNPNPPADVPKEDLYPQRMSVTAFADYLACPFRFYLKYILKMDTLDDEKRGMDAMDFGMMAHAVLQAMAANPDMRSCDNEDKLSAFLANEADKWVTERFGELPPLPVLVSLDAAKQRLGAAARVQAEAVLEGWEILESEKKFEIELNGMTISGKIDRIDRHRKTGEIRIIDYKTSDREKPPDRAHLGPLYANTPEFARVTVGAKEKRWTDLQLPLYGILISQDMRFDRPIQFAYFNLPKAISHTNIDTWEDLNEDLLRSAKNCAKEIVDRIHKCEFPPSTHRIEYDDFEDLFHGDVADCITPIGRVTQKHSRHGVALLHTMHGNTRIVGAPPRGAADLGQNGSDQ